MEALSKSNGAPHTANIGVSRRKNMFGKKIFLAALFAFGALLPQVCGATGNSPSKALSSEESVTEKDVSNVTEALNPSFSSRILDKKIPLFPILGVLAAVTYGVLHDQVTARLCIEYFNSDAVPHHKELLDDLNFPWKNSPTAVALLWGTAATWWVGLPIGAAVGAASRLGSMPKLSLRELIKPVGIYGAFVAGSSFIAGLAGYFLRKGKFLTLKSFPLPGLPAAKEAAFISNCFSHQAAYAAGAVGAVGLISWILYKRIKKLKEARKRALSALKKMAIKLGISKKNNSKEKNHKN